MFNTSAAVTEAMRTHALALGIQVQHPPILVGSPGGGKSSVVAAICRKLDLPLHVLPIPDKREPAQIHGLPDTGDGVVHWLPFEWQKAFCDLDSARTPNCVVLFDDISMAPAYIQHSLLQCMHDRRFGDLVLERAAMIGAANPASGSLDIAAALLNRTWVLDWPDDTLHFADLLRTGFPDPDVPVVDRGLWAQAKQVWFELLAAYLDTVSDLLRPDSSTTLEITDGQPFPSRRSWVTAMELCAAADAAGIADEDEGKALKVLMTRGCVGAPAANSFFTWLAGLPLPKPEEILGRPGLLTERGVFDRVDRLWVAVFALVRYTLFKGDVRTWKDAWQVLSYVAEQGKLAFAANAARVLNGRRPKGAPKSVPEMAAFEQILHPPKGDRN
ncbi:MAG: AAA family ATPase [Bdellovibrionales bacterium]|nr:AAA family ATPase [Bdellovibrionales bacterium]